MVNTGFRNPRRTVFIWLAVTVVSWAAVAWGAWRMSMFGQEAAVPGLAVGIGFPVAVIATGMLFLAARGARTVAATRRGVRVIARWTVSPGELARFAVNNAARNAHGPAYGNDWAPPANPPSSGLDILFDPDGVLVGDTYYGLVTTGMFKFEGVQILPENPLAIEFGMVATAITHATNVHVNTSRSVLRLPISRLGRDEAAKVLDYYKRVDARDIIVNPGFYRGRMRFGLIAAPICFALAALGFGMESIDFPDRNSVIPLVLAVVGVVAGIGGLVLALLAWALSAAQHRRRRTAG